MERQRCSTRGQLQHEPLTQNITACPVSTLVAPTRDLFPNSGQLSISVPTALGPCVFPCPCLGVTGSCSHSVCPQVRNDSGWGLWAHGHRGNHVSTWMGTTQALARVGSRACDSSTRCGGLECLGPAIHIANCSRYVRIQGLPTVVLGWSKGNGANGHHPSQVFALRNRNYFRLCRRLGCRWLRSEAGNEHWRVSTPAGEKCLPGGALHKEEV